MELFRKAEKIRKQREEEARRLAQEMEEKKRENPIIEISQHVIEVTQ